MMENSAGRRVVFGVMLSVFLAAMDATVVATAMPMIAVRLGGLAIYAWVFSGYLLASTVSMPLWGRLSDLVGRRPVCLVGLLVFLVGSALAGAAGSMEALVAARMVQGLGAGSILTIGVTIVGDLFTLEKRARLQGYVSGVWGVASLLGPVAGGLLADYVSWRWVFYLNVPLGALGIALIATSLRDAPRGRGRPVIDYAGLALFAVGVTATLLGVGEAGRAPVWWRTAVVLPLGVGVLALAAFVAVERRAREPIVPLWLFGDRLILSAIVTGFLSGMAMFGAISFVPLFVLTVIGTSATHAGLVLAPFVLGWVALSILSARLVFRLGYRALVALGMGFLVLAFLQLTQWSAKLTTGEAMRDVLLAGIGMGLQSVPMLMAVQSGVPHAYLGVATSVTQFFRTVGAVVGLSVMGAVMARQLAARAGMEEALHAVFITGFVVCLVALASALLVPAGTVRELARPDAAGSPGRA